jgi:protein TonB
MKKEIVGRLTVGGWLRDFEVGKLAVGGWLRGYSTQPTCQLANCQPFLLFLFLLLPFLTFAQQDSLAVAEQKVEVLPEYPGGTPALIRFLTENMRYPRKARRKSIEGVVLASFIIDQQGNLTRPKIKKGLGGGCNEEVLRLLALMPQPWKPATKHGKSVRVEYVLPIRFKLDKK